MTQPARPRVRLALILSVRGRDHDQHRSIDEHRQLIEPLASAPADAGSLIYAHVTAAEDRALARAGGAVAP